MLQIPAYEIAENPIFGIRKIWKSPQSFEKLNEDPFTKSYFEKTLLNHDLPDMRFELDYKTLGFLFLTCIIFCFIIMQVEIFDSSGYLKFVTQ